MHDYRGHIIANQRYVHSCMLQLKGSQACSLQQRSGLGGKHPKSVSTLLPQIDRGQCRSVLRGCQMSGVTMSQQTHTRTQQRQGVLSDTPTRRRILIAQIVGLLLHPFQYSIDRQCAILHYALFHPLECGHQVDSRRARRGQIVPNSRERSVKIGERGVPQGPATDINAISGCHSYGRCTPNPQTIDRLVNLLWRS